MKCGVCFAALGLMVGSCSLLVDSELERMHCKDENAIGPPACDPGQVCGDGVCLACATIDACGDGVDNDCNGEVDQRCPVGGAAAR